MTWEHAKHVRVIEMKVTKPDLDEKEPSTMLTFALPEHGAYDTKEF